MSAVRNMLGFLIVLLTMGGIQFCAAEMKHWQKGAVLLAVDMNLPYYVMRLSYPRSPLFKSLPFAVYVDGVQYVYDPMNQFSGNFSSYVESEIPLSYLLTNKSAITKKYKDSIHTSAYYNFSIDECRKNCTDNDGCSGFEFNNETNKCIIFYGGVLPPRFFESKHTFRKNVTSGIKNITKQLFYNGTAETNYDNLTYPGYDECESIRYTFYLSETESRGVRFTIYNCFEADGFIFETTAITALENTALDACVLTGSYVPPFCKTSVVNAPFPSFKVSFFDTEVKSTTWEGTYASMETTKLKNQDSNFGPLMLHIAGAIILFAPLDSPDDSFIATHVLNDCNISYTISGGVSGFITDLPKRASVSFLISSGFSFMEPLLKWGNTIRTFAVASYPSGPTVNNIIQRLGYWTDRRSYYSESWFLEHRTTSMLEVLKPVQTTFSMTKSYLKYFYITRAWIGSDETLFQCMKDFKPGDQFGSKSVYEFSDQLNASLIMTIPLLCKEFNATEFNTTVATSLPFDDPRGNPSNIVMPDLSDTGFWKNFFGKIFCKPESTNPDECKKNSGVFFAGVNYYTTLFPEVFARYNGAKKLFTNYASGAASYGAVVLLDDISPRDVIEAVFHPSMIAIMTKSDIMRNQCPLSPVDFGLFSLTSALNLSVILNSILTSQNVQSPDYRAILASMARGTGGFGDEVLRTDPVILHGMVNKGNEILWPSYGLMPALDPVNGLNPKDYDDDGNGTVLAVTRVGLYYYYQVMSINSTVTLSRDILPFSIEDSENFVGLDLDHNIPGCCNGCDAEECLDDVPFDHDPPTEPVSQLLLLSPEINCGEVSVHLLGEIGKGLRVSETRFTDVYCNTEEDSSFLLFQIRGYEQEEVTVLFRVHQSQKGNVMQHVKITFTEPGVSHLAIRCDDVCRLVESPNH